MRTSPHFRRPVGRAATGPWARGTAAGARRRLCGYVGAVLGTALSVAWAGAPAGATSPGAILWAQAQSAARATPTVHYTQVSNGDGQTTTITGEVNRVDGTQRITFVSGRHHGTATVTLVSHTTYVNGDAYGLQQAVGMPASLGTALAGHWISITPSAPNGLYQSTAAELSMPSVISNFDMKGPFTLGRSQRIGGAEVEVLHGYMTGTGKAKVPQTFYLRANTHPLPISSLSVVPGRHAVRMTTTYSDWGAAVSVSAPTGAVPIESLLKGGGGTTTTTAPHIVIAAATSISTAPPRGRAATPTAERV